MEKKIIFNEGYNKYYKVTIAAGVAMGENFSFEKLMFFIGQHKDYGKSEVGNAYVAIKEKTNALLGVNRKNLVLRTSKREVASLKKYFNTINCSGQIYVKIPFKIAYIFKAVSILVDEIHQSGFEINEDLKCFVNMTYADAFYKKHIEAYNYVENDIPEDMVAQRALADDFNGEYSSLNYIFI